MVVPFYYPLQTAYMLSTSYEELQHFHTELLLYQRVLFGKERQFWHPITEIVDTAAAAAPGQWDRSLGR